MQHQDNDFMSSDPVNDMQEFRLVQYRIQKSFCLLRQGNLENVIQNAISVNYKAAIFRIIRVPDG